MSNMSYCRFENTYSDLQDCYDALTEAQSVEALMEKANKYEKGYIPKLIELCRNIVDDFGDYNENYAAQEEDEE